MVLTDNARLAAWVRDRRDYDKKSNYHPRLNAKMTDLAAALGLEQLKKLPSFVKKRRQIAAGYARALRDADCRLPAGDRSREHSYYRYVVRLAKRPAAERFLMRRGIDAKAPVFQPLHRTLGLSDREFPETARAMREACSLPIYPSMTKPELRAMHAGLKALARYFPEDPCA